jgi:signal peptidase I
MEPTFSPGERVFSTSLSYGARVPFGGNRLPSFGSVKRGDLVIAELPFAAEKRVVADVVDDVLRFFTLQQGGLSGDELDRVGRDVLRRVVGLPGDTVRMESFVLYVRPAGKDRFVSEFETSPVRYQLNRLETPEGWTASDPFSGHMEAVELGEDEYFIAADKRNGSLDSRHFGPVSRERIQEKVILRFWPMSRFGVPES